MDRFVDSHAARPKASTGRCVRFRQQFGLRCGMLSCVVKSDGAIFIACGYGLTIGREGHDEHRAALPFELSHVLSRLKSPEPNAATIARRGDASSVGGKGSLRDR